jgi:hypothetical protein
MAIRMSHEALIHPALRTATDATWTQVHLVRVNP